MVNKSKWINNYTVYNESIMENIDRIGIFKN